jgi:hypothetical protein
MCVLKHSNFTAFDHTAFLESAYFHIFVPISRTESAGNCAKASIIIAAHSQVFFVMGFNRAHGNVGF